MHWSLRFGLACAVAGGLGMSAGACTCGEGADLDGNCAVDGGDLGLLLGAWGAQGGGADLDGSGSVDGGDLGALLASWGECPMPPMPCAGWAAIVVSGEVVGGAGAALPLVAITGTVDVLPTGEPQGTLVAVFGDGASVSISMALALVTVYVDESIVALPPGSAPDGATLDGTPTTIPLLLAEFETALAGGTAPGTWPVAARAVLGLAALCEIEPFCCDLVASLEEATSISSAFWCKIATVSVAGNMVAIAGSGCGPFEDACARGPAGAVGHFPMACGSLEALCTDEGFAGPAAAFDSVLGVWDGQ